MFSAKQISSAQEIIALLNRRRLPARLSTGEAAVLLGFQEHDIAPLIAAKLLAPLGRPAPNAPKYFATVDVVDAAHDREWLRFAPARTQGFESRRIGAVAPRQTIKLSGS